MEVCVSCDDVEEVAEILELDHASFLSEYAETWVHLLRHTAGNEEDLDWDWSHIMERECRLDTAHRHLGLHWRGKWQAVMVLRKSVPMRVSAVGDNGVYVCYLASAPWNRFEVRKRHGLCDPKPVPVGRWLMWTAMRWSQELGYEGRVALHSKKEAEKNYRKMIPGIEDGLSDPAEGGLMWMEVSERPARAFCDTMVLGHDGRRRFV